MNTLQHAFPKVAFVHPFISTAGRFMNNAPAALGSAAGNASARWGSIPHRKKIGIPLAAGSLYGMFDRMMGDRGGTVTRAVRGIQDRRSVEDAIR